jgi:hypothetical protein
MNEEDFHQYSKQNRRENLKYKKKLRNDFSDHYKDQNRSKKDLRAKKESIQEEEIWQDWEDYEDYR